MRSRIQKLMLHVSVECNKDEQTLTCQFWHSAVQISALMTTEHTCVRVLSEYGNLLNESAG